MGTEKYSPICIVIIVSTKFTKTQTGSADGDERIPKFNAGNPLVKCAITRSKDSVDGFREIRLFVPSASLLSHFRLED